MFTPAEMAILQRAKADADRIWADISRHGAMFEDMGRQEAILAHQLAPVRAAQQAAQEAYRQLVAGGLISERRS